MSTFVIGDIHGAYKALLQCLERSKFNKEKDILIQIGDVVDGWSESFECVEELLTIKNLIPIRGNHDQVFHDWMIRGVHGWNWLQGAYATAQSYIKNAKEPSIELKLTPHNGAWITNLNILDIPESHRKFFKHQLNYYIDEKDRCFVHGGFDRWESIRDQHPSILYWDRDLWNQAVSVKGFNEDGSKVRLKTVDDFKEIFIGHTATTFWEKDFPMKSGGITNMDTGAGWNGKLSIMNIDTYQVWQSDNVTELYKDEKGRRDRG